MAEANPKVQAMVERELKKNPALTNQELRTKAEKIDAAVKALTGRQFHAQYALPVRRALPATKRPRAAGAKRAKPAGTKRSKAGAKRTRSAGAERAKATRPAAKPRKAGSGRKRGAKRASAATSGDPVVALLEASYQSKKQALDGAVDAAFRRALEADSVSQVNRFLGWLDRQAKAVAAK